jgi:hypothetical protein
MKTHSTVFAPFLSAQHETDYGACRDPNCGPKRQCVSGSANGDTNADANCGPRSNHFTVSHTFSSLILDV